jgi:hypothetical protein
LFALMKLKDTEKEHLKNWGFDEVESSHIEFGIIESGAGALHPFHRYCLKALAELGSTERIVWPPKFQTQEAAN